MLFLKWLLKLGMTMLVGCGIVIVTVHGGGTLIPSRELTYMAALSNFSGIVLHGIDVERGLDVQLTPSLIMNPFYSWSPDGTRIAFSAYGEDSSIQIYLVNADGSDLRRITDCSVQCYQPVWSPDSQRIAFLSGIVELYVMNADGTHIIQLTASDDVEYGMIWSPDGSELIYAASTFEGEMLYAVPTDGSNTPRRLLDSGYLNFINFGWLAAGVEIWFIQQGIPAVIDRLNLESGEISRLSPDLSDGSAITFSPDRTQIAYVSYQTGSPDIFVRGINPPQAAQVTYNPTNDYEPVWSLDNHQLAFVSDRAGNADIFVMDMDSKRVRRLTDSPAHHDSNIQWRP